MKICVVGLGYIGLPTSAMFANYGVDVLGVDVSEHVVDTLNRGDIHIEEPGLEEMMKHVVANGKFKASLVPEEADAFIIAVPTPNKNDKYLSCDLSYVLSATKAVLPYVKKGNVVIVESTIGPRTMDDYVAPMFEEAGFKIGKDIFLSHCPERVLPGQILHELIHNNRIVGGITSRCTEESAKIYEIFVKGEIIRTEAKTAEMSKLMENTFRDVNIALANELTKVCNELKINVLDVIEMANKHPRVNIHQPGPGVGGHCLAVDPYFIYAKSPENAHLIKMARDTNVSMPNYVIKNTLELLKGVDNPKIAAFGVTYKGNVDDMRESPAMEIIESLMIAGHDVSIFDPHVENEKFVDLDTAVRGADIILVLVDHNEFKYMDHHHLASLMRNPLLFDTKNCVIEQANSGLEIINYGNIYDYLDKKYGYLFKKVQKKDIIFV